MTIHQLRVAIETVKGGTISSAAENLQISQPNASKNIKQLESELGFQLFVRNGNGVELTEKGYEFIDHAERIISEIDDISIIKSSNHIFQLRLGVMNYSPAIDSYLKLCAQVQDIPKADLYYITTSVNEGVTLLYEHKLDIVAAIYMNEYEATVNKMCRDKRLEIIPIAKVSFNVNFRKGHPLDHKDFLKNKSDLELLRDYAYIDYSNLKSVVGPMNGESEDVIPCRYRIYVDERDARCRLLSMTDGFSIGCQLSASVMDRYNLVCYPVNKKAADFVCIVRSGEANRKEIREYLNLLQEECRSVSGIGLSK